jgi:DNA-binding NarL/FixJ family response regulator
LIRVVIADDHAVVRRGLQHIVNESDDMRVVGEATNVTELLDLVSRQACDVLVLDISMPGRSGLDVLKDLKRDRPRLPVLVLSIHPEEQYAIRAFRSGAAGYLTKDAVPDQLLSALRKLVSGGRFLSAALAERLAGQLATDGAGAPHETLSDREYEVMCMLASGKSVTQIAADLLLSVKTVSTYRTRILEKMNLENNAQITHYAIQNRLIA